MCCCLLLIPAVAACLLPLLPQQLAQVLARTPLAELLAALLAAPAPASARQRGMCCRLVSPAEGPPLAPVSSRGGDVALALLLLLVGAALNDEESSWQEIGLEGIAQQVGGAGIVHLEYVDLTLLFLLGVHWPGLGGRWQQHGGDETAAGCWWWGAWRDMEACSGGEGCCGQGKDRAVGTAACKGSALGTLGVIWTRHKGVFA
jgi:hypothetical protein